MYSSSILQCCRIWWEAMAWFLHICCCISMQSCDMHCNGKLLFWLRFFHIHLRFWIYWSTFLCHLTWLFPDVRVIFFMHRTCFCFWTSFPTPYWLLDVVVVIWSRHFFRVQYGREWRSASTFRFKHGDVGASQFSDTVVKIFKAVLLPSWYFSVIVLLCLSPIWCAVRILQIHLYSLTFIIWDLGRLLMPYLWLVLSLLLFS